MVEKNIKKKTYIARVWSFEININAIKNQNRKNVNQNNDIIFQSNSKLQSLDFKKKFVYFVFVEWIVSFQNYFFSQIFLFPIFFIYFENIISIERGYSVFYKKKMNLFKWRVAFFFFLNQSELYTKQIFRLFHFNVQKILYFILWQNRKCVLH